MTHISIGGDRFEVQVEGDATRPALLLSNALGTDLSLWDGQMAALLPHFRVIRYDSRGHGGSDLGTGPLSIARLGQDALAILDALHVEKAHVIGLSMGGAVAQWLLAHAPTRIDRVVLATTAAKLGTPGVWNERISVVRSTGMASVAEDTMDRWFSDAFRDSSPDAVARIHDAVRATAPESYAASCAALRDMDLREALRGIDRPVLVVTGRDDLVIDEQATAALLSALDGATHVELDARHLANIEAEADFNAAAVAFLTAKTTVRKPSTRKGPIRKTTKAATRANAARSPLKAVATKTAKAKPVAKAVRKGRPVKAPVSSRRPLAKTPAEGSSRAAPAKASARKAAPTRAKTRPVKTRAAATITATTKSPKTRSPKTKTATRGSTAKRPAGKVAAKKTAAKTVTTPVTRRKPGAKATAGNTVAAKTTVAKKTGAKKAIVKKAIAKKAVAKRAAAKKPVAKTRPAKTAIARRKPTATSRGALPRRRP